MSNRFRVEWFDRAWNREVYQEAAVYADARDWFELIMRSPKTVWVHIKDMESGEIVASYHELEGTS